MKSIRRQCACGCKQVTGLGSKWIRGHSSRNMSKEHRDNLSLAHKEIKFSKKHKRNISLAKMGNTNTKGHKLSKEHKIKLSLTKIKYNPNYQYCDEWKDKEYRKDLLKNYCENIDCRGNIKQLGNHHINLNKKDCRPVNAMTLCQSCHMLLHWKLNSIASKRGANHKDYLTIKRTHKITYVLKKTRETLTLKRME